jgi:hypothetical protein
MNPLLITKAIQKLSPNSEFSFSDTDLDSLVWHSDTIKPTKAKILETVELVKAEELAEAEAKATARASALAKLAALGLSADEIAAL